MKKQKAGENEYKNCAQSIAVDMAIEAMKKIQKIEQIIEEHDEDRMPEDYWYIDRIREVINNDSN